MRRSITISLATLIALTLTPVTAHPVPVPAQAVRARAHPISALTHPVPNRAHLVPHRAHLVSDRAHLVSDRAHLVSDRAHPVPDHSHPVRSARPLWRQRIDSTLAGLSVSVAVRAHGRRLYAHAAAQRRAPASNLKLILSMALLDRFGPALRLPTFAASRDGGRVIQGKLWILGRGDPSLAEEGKFASSIPFGATRLGRLARKIKAAGVRAIRGRVMGSTGYFEHDWYAPGWKPHFPVDEVALPSALTFNGNVAGNRHIDDPERRAAVALTRKLRKLGVSVGHSAGAGLPPRGLRQVARVTSRPLWTLVRYMDRKSSNFFAEVLGKRLAVERYGRPGTIAKAAHAVSSWAGSHGVSVTAYDASGLSYFDRISARGIVRLLSVAGRKKWGPVLRRALPAAGEGTLSDRLAGVRVRAKTGTLDGISALSGWVWLRRSGRWARFSILDHGMSRTRSSAIEGTIVRIISRHAR